MTRGQRKERPDGPNRARRAGLTRLVAIPLAVILTSSVAWAYWGAGSVPGGNGASAATSVNPGATPTASAAGRAVTVSWSASTLSNGNSVAGYIVKRYSGSTLQAVLTACNGTIAGTSCIENNVPVGTWSYSVTPLFATSWSGPESVKSIPVTVAAPTLTLSPITVRPSTSLTGTATGFIVGETLQYRLDNPSTGTVLTGSLAGSPTPAVVPAGGVGSVVVTVPSGTSDGAHTIYAVTSPSGDAAAAAIVVDGTAPPLPVLTLTPAATSGDAATFAYTEAEASATVECTLDGAPFATCTSPVDYAGLAAGSHTFQARAIDTVGNVSASTSYTWTVNLTVPTIAIAFPTQVGLYNSSGFDAGCGTASTGDVCGSASDDVAVTAVNVSLRQVSTGLYWNGTGTSFNSATEVFLGATGTTDWAYAILASAFAEGDYTLRAQASDGANFGYDSRTFTIDRAAPAAPTITSGPSGTTTAGGDTFSFTGEAGASFECRLDAGAYAPCASPQTYGALATGSHTFDVRAVDGAGNTGATTSRTWTVDATAPTAAMTFPTTTSYNLTGWAAGCGTPATGDLCGTASDVGSGLTSVAVSIRRVSTNSYWDGGTFAAASETWLGATGTASWSYLFAGAGFPADGSYAVRWRATDAVGNATTGGVDLTLDTTPPPAPQIVSAPSDPSGGSAQFDFTDADASATISCRLDAAVFATCTSPVAYASLATGSHTFQARATDTAGNVSALTSYTWTVNTNVPNIAITFPAAVGLYNSSGFDAGCGTASTGDVCGSASDDVAVTAVNVSLRRLSTGLYWNGTGTSFNSATEVFLGATGTTNWTYAILALAFAEGDYTLRAQASDGANFGYDSRTFTIDRTAPAAPTITSGPSGTTGSGATLSFTGEPGASFECRLDAGTWAPCTSPKTYSALATGSHTFDVRAVDGAGNAGASTRRTWTVDATAPTVGTTFPVAGTRYSNTKYDAGCGTATTGDICGTASDLSGVSKVEISVQRASTGLYLTGTTFSAASQNWITATGTTSWSYALAATTFPADDTYTLVVRATDAVGNAGTSSTAFVIDRTKPTAVGFTTTNVSTVSKLEAGDTFTLTYSEAVAPGSIIAGWNGATTQNVVVRATNSATNDKLTIYSSDNGTLLPLGTVSLKRGDYVTSARTFGLAGSATLSTLTMSGSSLTIRLGTPSGATGTAGGTGNVIWTPNALATDLAGNTAATTTYTETDNDNDF